jgi:hypothetical protein
VLLAASYPYLKRYTYLPQVYLGMAFGWGIPMGFAALTGTVPPVAWVLYVANIFWATAYDTWYAMVDRDDDWRVKSTAILFGDMDSVAQGVARQHVRSAALVGREAQMGLPYWVGLALALVLVAYQFVIARGRSREACFRAFLHNHWVGWRSCRHRADFARTRVRATRTQTRITRCTPALEGVRLMQGGKVVSRRRAAPLRQQGCWRRQRHRAGCWRVASRGARCNL